ncbi:hypothetical protein Hypma_012238 [Hypsizygus marmoreus]|uniref:Uncharacterized protein n=1 Tax=Hypsizygus marmoreus TaxID=39966 RepID=A0A369JJL2_HYPMA|nr:hypothetical protein Hypma_012238 [Hypsizygus marmoreus]
MPRLGGWIMTFEELIAWAARVKDKPVEDVKFPEAFMHALVKLENVKMDISCVSYPAGVSKIMVVTRYGESRIWKFGDDPKMLPQFKMGKKEERVRRALENEGIKGLEFVTSHGQL